VPDLQEADPEGAGEAVWRVGGHEECDPMDPDAVTEQQAVFLVHLREQREAEVAERFRRLRTNLIEKGMAAMLYALLRPARTRPSGEASEVIDVLMNRDLTTYSRKHTGWAQPFLDRVTASFGDHGERLLATWGEVKVRIDGQ
jgi:hypothetical protein